MLAWHVHEALFRLVSNKLSSHVLGVEAHMGSCRSLGDMAGGSLGPTSLNERPGAINRRAGRERASKIASWRPWALIR